MALLTVERRSAQGAIRLSEEAVVIFGIMILVYILKVDGTEATLRLCPAAGIEHLRTCSAAVTGFCRCSLNDRGGKANVGTNK